MRRSWLRLFLAGVVVVGAVAGYLVSSGLGDRLLHQEIETQLSRLLSGSVEIAEVELRFANGLRLEARGLEAYPSVDQTGPPVLRAGRVSAWIDLLALLVGRLELSTLILDGPHLRIEQEADGSFVGLPLPPITARSDTEKAAPMAELIAQRLESLDPAVMAFTERFHAADRIEILNGSVSWIDHGRPREDGTPQEFRLELVSGFAQREWLTHAIALEWSAVFVDGEHTPFPVGFELLHRDESPRFEWTASFSKVPLAAAKAALPSIEPIEELSGSLDARLRFATSGRGHHTLDFEGVIEDATISLRQTESIIELEQVEIQVELALDNERLHLSEGRLNGQRLGIEFKGAIDRPIRPDARTRLEALMVGIRIDGIRDLAERVGEQSDLALAISLITQRVEAGHIRYIQAGGTAPLQHWQDLATGRTQELPDGFLFAAAVEEIVLGTGSTDRIEELEGELEWVGDQISLRNMTAIYHDRPLPKMDLVVDGISHLISASESARTMTGNPPSIPGITPLIEIFKPRNPNLLPLVKAAGVEFDWLEHPLFRWPIRDVRVLVEPLRRGMQMNIREGTWGGAAVEGNVVWFNDPKSPSVTAQLVLGPPPTAQSDSTADESEAAIADSSNSTSKTGIWASGRFEIEFRPRPNLPFQSAAGFFRVDGANLSGNEIEVELASVGQAALRTSIDISKPDSIGLDLSFAITEANFEGMSEFVVLPPTLVTGDVGATGSVKGLVRPKTSFIAELDGRVRVEATNGAIKTSLPLLLRLGKASEGYNPFANEDELQYESMKGTIDLDRGLLSVEDFEIEGPLRVFANARLDTNRRPSKIKAVVGIFLFRSSGQFLDNLPLVRSFLPGSKRGLIGAYFEVNGPINEPSVEALPLQTLMSSVPDAIKAPFKVMRFLFGRGKNDS